MTKVIWTAPDGRELTQDHIDLFVDYFASLNNEAITPTPEPTPDPIEPVVTLDPEPEPDPEPEEVVPSFSADSVTKARNGFKQKFGKAPADCDPNADGSWTCYAEKVGSNAGASTPEPTKPVDPEPGNPEPANHDVSVDAPNGSANLQKIPKKFQATWRVNLAFDPMFTYQDQNGKWKQLVAFWEASEEIFVTQRDFPNGKWEKPVNIHKAVMGNVEMEWDSHTAIAVSVCPQTKKIVVVGGHHSDPMYMGISNKPGDINGGWTKFDDKNIDGEYYKRLTYPSMNWVGKGKDCRLAIYQRDQRAGGGHSRFKSSIFIYEPSTGKLNQTTLNTGLSLRLYTGNLGRDETTGDIYLSCIWRDETRDHPLIKSHFTKQDLFEIHSPNGKDWYQRGSNKKLQLPLIWNESGTTWRNGIQSLPKGHEVPVKIWETSPNNKFNYSLEPNSSGGPGTIVCDGKGYPHIINTDRKTKSEWHNFWNGTEWVKVKLPYSKNTMEGIRLPNGDFGMLVHDNDTVSFHEVDQKTGKMSTKGYVLSKGGANGSWSVIPDHGAMQAGYVSYIVSQTGAGGNDQYRKKPRPSNRTEDAWVVTIPMSELKSGKVIRI